MKKMKFEVLMEKYPTKYTPIMKMYYWLTFPLMFIDLIVKVISLIKLDLYIFNELMQFISEIYLLSYIVIIKLDCNLRKNKNQNYKYWDTL
ncbi:hypothetical protein XA3_04270 [Xylocopilactobacillus apicola]|uniref:Uncharacterized protein n=1 Tax=Xylocopilactobacillus apicola TaxID=2932184 RepID=A0AAU9D6K2_9LACO|nr:hypothetical protein XA3_04270 [Xylocopilactobacillus apicola]